MPGPELRASDITWRLQPFTPAPADTDPLVAAILDGIAYRRVMTHALAGLHDLQVRFDQLSEQHRRLQNEYRHLRAQTMRAAR